MDKNWKEINEFLEKHDGEIVIFGMEIVRLIGIRSDAEDDYYYYWHIREFGLDSKEKYVSCVCGLIPLKDYLSYDDYDNLERVFFLNTEHNYRHLWCQYDKWGITEQGEDDGEERRTEEGRKR